MDIRKKDVFVALAAVAWADGQLDPDEADAIVRAAVDCGLELDEINEIEQATKEQIDLGALDRTTLGKQERMFVYAVACWIAQLDGRLTDEEQATILQLGDKLGVPERARRVSEKLAKETAQLPDGDRPARYDLDRLWKAIGDRLQPTS